MRLFLLFLLVFSPQCLGLKALIYNIGIGKSHFMFTGAMVDSLVERGHEADLLLAIWNPVAANNGTEKAARVFRVEVEDPPLVHAGYLRPFDPPNDNFYELFDQSRLLFCERILSNAKLMADLRSAKYDIGLSPPYDSCGMSLFHMLGIPATAIFTATPPTFFILEALGIPAPPSFVTDGIHPVSISKTYSFKERFVNALQYYKTYFLAQRLFLDEHKLIQKYYPQVPTPVELFRNVSYYFVNHNELLDTGRPISAKVKFIGGIQLKDDHSSAKLSKKYDDLLAKAPKGAVLFSFGTTASSRVVPKKVREEFIEAFKQFPDYIFIWKHDNAEDDQDKLKGVENIVAKEWLPQKQLLADPRVKVFITHAGMNSFVEFARHGVPALTVPLSVDQHVNAASAVGLGIALHLKKEEISAKKIKEKLEILLADNRYRQRAIKLSKALKASPNRPQQTFVESVEFAAAFPDTSEYLQLPSVYLNPFVVHSFDVFAVIFGVIFTFLIFFVPIVIRAVMYSCNLPPSHLKYKHE